MVKKEGLLIVFEGIDGAGTSTQVPILTAYIKKLDKYLDVVETHEPWDSAEINKRLAEDKDAYSGGLQMAGLYVGDRTEHTHRLIRPNLEAGTIVITDRYSMSTCAYQWAQGVEHERLISMHKNRGILTPDITFLVNTSLKEARKRMELRGEPLEKFEANEEFVGKLISRYETLAKVAQVDPSFFGNVVIINGDKEVEEVAAEIKKSFDPLYNSWKKGDYVPQILRNKN